MNALYQMMGRYVTQFLATHKTALDWIDTMKRDHPDVEVIKFNMADKQPRLVPLNKVPSPADIVAPYDVLDRLGQVTQADADASDARPAASTTAAARAPAFSIAQQQAAAAGGCGKQAGASADGTCGRAGRDSGVSVRPPPNRGRRPRAGPDQGSALAASIHAST
jgi:hypothetical protein